MRNQAYVESEHDSLYESDRERLRRRPNVSQPEGQSDFMDNSLRGTNEDQPETQSESQFEHQHESQIGIDMKIRNQNRAPNRNRYESRNGRFRWNFPDSPSESPPESQRKDQTSDIAGESNEIPPEPQYEDHPESQPAVVKSPSTPSRKHNWTFSHSFYAVMGGFAIDLSHIPEDERYLPNQQVRCALTTSGMAWLFNRRLPCIPDISKADIEDKSKGGSFAKTVVCVQLIWFFGSCMVRWKAHLTLSLFEANVLVHVLWAIFVYVIWWDKPYEVDEPTLIEPTPELDKDLALMLIFNNFDTKRPYPWDSKQNCLMHNQRIEFPDRNE
jgi:hypothetical protein